MKMPGKVTVSLAAIAALSTLGLGASGATAAPLDVIVAEDGSVLRSSAVAAQYPQFQGHYEYGNPPCAAGRVPGGVFVSHKGCGNRGRYLMANVHDMTGAGYRVGYYTYECEAMGGNAAGNYQLQMVGFVKVFHSDAGH